MSTSTQQDSPWLDPSQRPVGGLRWGGVKGRNTARPCFNTVSAQAGASADGCGPDLIYMVILSGLCFKGSSVSAC